MNLTLIFSLFVLTGSAQPAGKTYESKVHKFRVETLVEKQGVVWGFDFLKDGNIIFTERDGNLKILNLATKAVSPVSGAPKVWANGQGGLLDIRVDPENPTTLFMTYVKTIAGKGGTTALATAELSGKSLEDLKELFVAEEASDEGVHFGSRIEFDKAGHVFFAMGDRGDRPKVQSLNFHNGKMMRLKKDGSVPKDNPYLGVKDAMPEIWALGLRSPQGLSMHPKSGVLWETEMGPRGGDEVNIIEPKKNYGWADVTYGREYYGPSIGVKEKPGITQPVVYWVPSISPSGSNFYFGDAFPQWKGNLFVGTLSGTHLRRLVVNENKVVEQEELLKDLGFRFRNVRGGPDGHLYFSTDNGKIARLVPVK